MRPPPPEMTCSFLIQLAFCKKKKKTMSFIGVEVEQETGAPPPKKKCWISLVYKSDRHWKFTGNFIVVSLIVSVRERVELAL